MAASAIRNTLKIGMIPADGIGREVLPVIFGFTHHNFLQAIADAIRAIAGRSKDFGGSRIVHPQARLYPSARWMGSLPEDRDRSPRGDHSVRFRFKAFSYARASLTSFWFYFSILTCSINVCMTFYIASSRRNAMVPCSEPSPPPRTRSPGTRALSSPCESTWTSTPTSGLWLRSV